jgi:hypothetical protein
MHEHNILIIKMYHYEILLTEIVLIPNTLASIQTTLEAESGSSITIVLTRRADIEHIRVSHTPSRNSKTNFQNRRAEFRFKVNLNNKQ